MNGIKRGCWFFSFAFCLFSRPRSRGHKLMSEISPSAAVRKSAVCRGRSRATRHGSNNIAIFPKALLSPSCSSLSAVKRKIIISISMRIEVGRHDQGYNLRVGRYGLVDMEFSWDQIPHIFSLDTARTPYGRPGGGGTFTLPSKPTTTAGTDVRDWVNAAANPVDLKLLSTASVASMSATRRRRDGPSPGLTGQITIAENALLVRFLGPVPAALTSRN